jgi:aryl-alcohol dehydrogenase-like predicted oxidoreductase
LEYVGLGSSGLCVSRLALGCEPLGGTDWGNYDVKDVFRAIDTALAGGINTFDVAEIYGLGLAEERLAEALGERRKDAIIITKFGIGWQIDGVGSRARTFADASPPRVAIALEGCLRRLRIDCVPVFLLHKPDPATPLDETLDVLEKCRVAGKIRCYGLSNFAKHSAAQAFGRAGFATIQNQYNLIQRSSEALYALAANAGVGVLSYGTLAHGLLTGKYSPDSCFPVTDRRHRLDSFSKASWRANHHLLQRLSELANKYASSPSGIAIRWVLSNPSVTSAIVGAKSPQQVEDITRALEIPLTEEDRSLLTSCR